MNLIPASRRFSFFLPNTSAKQAYQFAKRLLEAINQTEVNFNDQVIQYTASIGVILSSSSEVNTVENLINQADKALYRAKENGRNQMCIHNETKNFSNPASAE